jgi:hypothetical protein
LYIVYTMAKPLVTSTFFSFPKLLLWSLPLFVFLLGSWLTGYVDKDSILSVLHSVESVEHEVAGYFVRLILTSVVNW